MTVAPIRPRSLLRHAQALAEHYLSLIIYESQKLLVRCDPTLVQTLALTHANIIEQARHRIKLFDDTHLGMEGVTPDSVEALFKIRFVTLYHVLKGLKQLRTAHLSSLDWNANQRLVEIEQDRTTTTLLTDNGRRYRNTLVHYGLNNNVPTGVLDLERPLAGLTEFYFPRRGFSNLAIEVKRHAERVSKSLDDWAS